MRYFSLTVRILLGVLGGYSLSAQASVLIALYAPNTIDGIASGLLLSFVIYPVLMLWAFSTEALGRTCAMLLAITLLFWLLIEVA